jgi:ATP-dependent DNA ligase
MVPHDVIKPKLKTYGEKIEFLKEFVKKVKKPELVYQPQYHYGHDNIKKLIKQTLKENKEGIIATSLTHPEKDNLRLKVKHKKTWNLKIRDIHQAIDIHGKPKKEMGALVLEDSTGRECGEVGTGFTRDMRQDVWAHPRKWKGKLVQVKGMDPVRPGMKLKMLVYNGLADGDIDKIP